MLWIKDYKKKCSFKNGKQHGKLQFFDEAGNVTLEYMYDNGEKISGGIVEQANTEDYFKKSIWSTLQF